MLSSVSTSKVSPGDTSAISESVADSAYLSWPLAMTCPLAALLMAAFPWASIEFAPGHQHALELAHDEGEEQRERDGRHQRGEHLGDDVEAAGLEDGVAQPFAGGHELA